MLDIIRSTGINLEDRTEISFVFRNIYISLDDHNLNTKRIDILLCIEGKDKKYCNSKQ